MPAAQRPAPDQDTLRHCLPTQAPGPGVCPALCCFTLKQGRSNRKQMISFTNTSPMRLLRDQAWAWSELKAVGRTPPADPTATLWSREGQSPPFLSGAVIPQICSRINSHRASHSSCQFPLVKVLPKTQHPQEDPAFSRGSSWTRSSIIAHTPHLSAA